MARGSGATRGKNHGSLEEVVAFWSKYQPELLAQGVMFVLSAGAYLGFFRSLRSVLMRAEAGTGTLSTIAFGAGIVSAGLQVGGCDEAGLKFLIAPGV